MTAVSQQVRTPASSRTGAHPFLEPTRGDRAAWVGDRVGRAHPVVAVVGSVVAAFVALAGVLILSGLALTHLGVLDPATRWDDHVNVWFADHRTSGLNSVSAGFTWLANTLGVVVVAAAVSLLLFIRRWGRMALLLLIGLSLELAAFLSSNYTVARPRPDVEHLGSTPSTFSWPSGHVAATFVLYGGIAVIVMAATRRWLLIALAWTTAILLTTSVAVSRVYRGEHHPLDTVAGLALGIGALAAAVFAIRVWGEVTDADRDAAATR